MTTFDFEAIRDQNLRHLSRTGFQVADSLPTGPNEGGSSLRPVEEIGRRLLALQCAFLYAGDFGENVFCCAHNAVRSAQLGEETVPDEFDPVYNGGVMHERRHALTWALSPGVRWDETELST